MSAAPGSGSSGAVRDARDPATTSGPPVAVFTAVIAVVRNSRAGLAKRTASTPAANGHPAATPSLITQLLTGRTASAVDRVNDIWEEREPQPSPHRVVSHHRALRVLTPVPPV